MNPIARLAVCVVLAAAAAGGGPSHLSPHLVQHAPARLLRPLAEDGEGVLKGWNAAAEAALAEKLRGQTYEKLLRVAVLDVLGFRAVGIKLQAGDWPSGEFRLEHLHRDFYRAAQAAFSPPVSADHCDIWAAVAWRDPAGELWHWPVFSASIDADEWSAGGQPSSADELLQRAGFVRYDPIFTRWCTDRAGWQPPGAAVTVPFPDLEAVAARAPGIRRACTVRALLRGQPASRAVAITIDDGPRPMTTAAMLAVLRRLRAKATFFLVGEKVAQYPRLARRIVADGHCVGNHAFTNRRLSRLPAREAWAELKATSELIEKYTGARPRFMRPPGGDINEQVLSLCARLGLTPVFWTHNTGDWRDRTPEEIAAAATRNIHGGAIILMHQGRPQSVRALIQVVVRLREMGYRLVTIDELAAGTPLVMGTPEAVMAALRQRRWTEAE